MPRIDPVEVVPALGLVAGGLFVQAAEVPDIDGLDWGKIDAPDALAGTEGVDCKLVHGRRDELMKKDHNIKVEGNRDVTVDGNLNRTVGGYYDETFCSWHNTCTIGTSLFVYNGDNTENHNRVKSVNQNFFHFDVSASTIGWTSFILDIKGLDIEVTGVEVEVNGIALESTGFGAGYTLIKAEGEAIDLKDKILKASVKKCKAEFNPAALITGCLEAGLQVEVNGMPVARPNSFSI